MLQTSSSTKATSAAHSNAIAAVGGCCAKAEADAVLLFFLLRYRLLSLQLN